MSLELFNVLASAGTFLVIAATAIAAIVQLRHLRRSNQLQAVLALRDERRYKNVDEAFLFVSYHLAERMKDPAYRAGLEMLTPDRQEHKELDLCDYYEHVGAYLKKGLIDEDIYFEFGNPKRYWKLVAPAIAIYRRSHGPQAYENFEYLVVRAKIWDAAHPQGTFPKTLPRLNIENSD